MRLRQLLLHQLTCIHEVGAGLEQERDRRKPVDRLRAQHADALRPIQEVCLRGNGDKLLDFFRGEAEGLGLDLDVRRRELGKDVHRRVAQLRDAEDHHPCGDADDQEPETQARINN